jgi:hypothetical protein
LGQDSADEEVKGDKGIKNEMPGEVTEAENKNETVDILPDTQNDLEEERTEKDSA